MLNPQSLPNQLQLPSQNWLGKVTRRLSIRQKIAFGYGLALGTAVLGTTIGFLSASYYHQQAQVQREDAIEKIRFLDRLQISSLQIQAHQQQFIFLLEKPNILQKHYTHYSEHSVEFKQLWASYKSTYSNTKLAKAKELEQEALLTKSFLQEYKDIPDAYIEQADKRLQQIVSMELNPEGIRVAQQILLDFNNSWVNSRFDDFSDDLTKLVRLAHKYYEQAELQQEAAQVIQVRTIAASTFLSVVIAIFLAWYISRAIALPIQATTSIAKQVIQDNNFSLQAPITTKDEVGALATSFNELIQRVKLLIEEQEAANQAQLIQSEKMSSLGRMMAGVAHEINNPINFIHGNVIHASDYVRELLELLEMYAIEVPYPSDTLQKRQAEIDLEFLKEDLPKLLKSMQVGIERTTQIVHSLKDFSRLDNAAPHPVDLPTCMDSTLLILNNRLKEEITVIRNYGNIPNVEGYAGLLYQVFMNLLSNAIDALKDSSGEKLITITMICRGQDTVAIKIADNGPGIPLGNQAKIFDSFFTTKPRGIGTGLGLAISQEIVVEKHGGKITCQSEEGVGTEFAIALPIKYRNTPKSSSPTDSQETFLEKYHCVNLN